MREDRGLSDDTKIILDSNNDRLVLILVGSIFNSSLCSNYTHQHGLETLLGEPAVEKSWHKEGSQLRPKDLDG